MSSLKIIVFLGSTREGRFGIRAAKYMLNLLLEEGHDAELFDPMEMNFIMLKKPYFFYEDSTQIPPLLQSAHEKILAADAYFVVSAEYNNSIPPGLTNMMDHFPVKDYKYKPCGIVCYSIGQFGGVCAAMQLRTFLSGLGMITPHFVFAIPKVHEALTEDGEPLDEYVKRGGKKVISQLVWLGHAIKNHTENFGRPPSMHMY